MELAVRPHLMSDRESVIKRDIQVGTTIQQAVDQLEFIDPRVRNLNLAVFVNGQRVERDQWAQYRITGAETSIEIAAVLSGGRRGKSVLGLIAIIALSVYAGPLATSLTGATKGIGFAFAKAGIMMVGSLAINAIFAPPRISDNTRSTPKESNAYTFSGQNNQVRRFGALMRIYGRHRVKPDLAALPYTMNIGEDQFFTAIYCFGYGPLKLEDFKIGQNPITNYKDVTIVVHERFTHPSQLQVYKNDVWQDGYNAELKKNTGPITATTQADTTEAIVDIMFPQGLGYVNDKGGVDERETVMYVEFAPSGTTTYQAANLTTAHTAPGITHRTTGILIAPTVVPTGYFHTVRMLVAGSTTASVHRWGDGPNAMSPPSVGSKMNIGPYVVTINVATSNFVSWVEPLPGDVSGDSSGFINIGHDTNGNTPGENAGFGQLKIRMAKRGSFITSVSMVFPYAGAWTIRIHKIDDDIDPNAPDAGRTMTTRTLVAVKSLKSIPPLNPEVPLAIVELRIRANGQLNASVEEFSGIATSILPVWTPAVNDFREAETRNPAWIVLDILSGTANRRRLPYSRIDLDRLKEWGVFCDTIQSGFSEKTGTCDVVLDSNRTVWEVLQSVATCGRATPTMRDNKYSVIIDSEGTRTPVQMFTPRNSWNLRSTRTYVDEPHALRVKWIDPFANYQPAEITVYNTGHSALTAVKFEEIATFGMTRPEQVTRYGRYMLAQGRLRQERFTIETDIENIVCIRGDMVLVAHDVIDVGGEASRIKEIQGTNTLIVDTGISLFELFEQNEDMGIRVRLDTGVISAAIPVTAIDHSTGAVTVSSSLVALGAKPGDLFVYGLVTQTTGSYIVDKIVPGSDLSATIYLEEYAPGVYDAERTGEIPPYIPQGGLSYIGPPPNNFQASVVEYTDSGVDPSAIIMLTWAPPDGADKFPPDHYRLWATDASNKEVYVGEVRGLAYRDGPVSLWVYGGTARRYKVRAFHSRSGLSNAAETSVILPARNRNPPRPPDTFLVQALENGIRKYTWGYTVLPEGYNGVMIRYMQGTFSNPSWELMSPLNFEPLTQNGYETAFPAGEGPFTFAIRTTDTTGTISETSRIFNVTLNLSSLDGGGGQLDGNPPPTPGSFEATGGISVIFLEEHGTQEYLDGGGHDYTNVYGAKYTGGPLPTFDNATIIGTYKGRFGVIPADPGAVYHIWIKWVARNRRESVSPSGGLNGVQVETAYDPGRLLDILTGQIQESHFHQSLNSRIDLIDGDMPGSVNARDEEWFNIANTKITTEISISREREDLLRASYVIRLDLNGYVVGFGIAAENDSGLIRSAFQIRADRFYIASPSGPSIQPQIPFIVQTTSQFINGEHVPAGVYITDAFIRNGTITSAKIGNAAITNAKIGNAAITFAKIGTAEIDTLHVRGEAITTTRSAYSAGESSVSANTGQQILQQLPFFQSKGGPIVINAASVVRIVSGSASTYGMTFRIRRNGGILMELAWIPGNAHQIIPPIVDQPGPFGVVYDLTVDVFADSGLLLAYGQRSMYCLETTR